MQPAQIEDAQADAAAFKDRLVAALGLLQHLQRALLVGDVAQHPGMALLQGVALDGEQARFAVLFERQVERLFACLHGVQARQQFLQRVTLCRRAEQLPGLRIEIAQPAAGIGDQDALLDGVQHVVGPPLASLAEQAAQHQTGAGPAEQKGAEPQQRQFAVRLVGFEQGMQLPAEQSRQQQGQGRQQAFRHAAQARHQPYARRARWLWWRGSGHGLGSWVNGVVTTMNPLTSISVSWPLA
ncbi:hypothetical protein D9M70_377020 [compost metagenome]